MCQSFCCPHLEEAGGRMCVCVCVWLCGCLRINACTCAWRARRRQQSPERTLYLERASHDLAWSRPSFLGWGLRTPMCVCVWMLSAGDLQIFEMAVPLRIGLRSHSANLTDSLVQLSANKTAHWQGPNTWLLRNVICHEMTEEKLLTPLCA